MVVDGKHRFRDPGSAKAYFRKCVHSISALSRVQSITEAEKEGISLTKTVTLISDAVASPEAYASACEQVFQAYGDDGKELPLLLLPDILVMWSIPPRHIIIFWALVRKLRQEWFEGELPLSLSMQDFEKVFGKFLRRVRDRVCRIKIERSQFLVHQSSKFSDEYEEGEVVGAGQFGVVSIVTHRHTGRQCVMKKIKRDCAEMSMEDLEGELSQLKMLDHPHIVRMFEWFDAEDAILLVLEAAQGGDLRVKLQSVEGKQVGLDENFVQVVTRQALNALSYIHSQCIMHRDIKPANMLLSTPDDMHPHLLIADFGVAEMFASCSSKLKGTFAYMAPEGLENKSTPRSDVWSLGICTYELLCGKRPFGSDMFDVYRNVMKKEPDYEKLESPMATDFVKQALVKNEPERPLASELLSCSWFTASRFELTEHNQKKIKQSFENYARSSHFAKVVLNCVAVQLNSSELSDLSGYFDLLDHDADGCVTPLALRSTLKSFGLEGEFDQLWAAIDINRDGHLQYSEFMASMLSTRPKLLDDAMLRVFTLFDTDNDNAMSFQELNCMLSGSPNQGVLPDGKTIERLMGEMDSGMDGTITFSDFRSYFLKELQKGSSVVGVESVASALKNIAVVVGRSECEMQVQADHLSEKHWITTVGDLKQLSRLEWSRLGLPSKLENALRNYVGMG